MSGYFVTGTDTNVGKTYVTCALARRSVELGHKVFAFKPIESGCSRGADGRYRRLAADTGASGARMAKAASLPRPAITTTGDRRRHL